MNKLFTPLAILFLVIAFAFNSYAQPNVLNPNDPDVIYTTTTQPPQPAWNNYNIVKWGHTNRLSWNPYSKGYRCYYFQNMAFRIKFPKTYVHNLADGKKYPMLIFFHGRGEAGTIYDNEYQLLHGGQNHANKVDDGTFDGFLLYAQSTTGNSQDYFQRISSLIDSLVKYVKLDADRVILNGLSSGGQASWEFVGNANYARKTAATLPMCAAKNEYVQTINNFLTIPVWVGYGGLDPAPAAGTVEFVANSFANAGGTITRTLYPTQGHGMWGSFWNEPDYWPFLNRQHKANPLVYFGRKEFCPGIIVDARLGLQAGFNAYQWEKDGVVIAGATSNTLNVNSYGTYRGRYRRTSTSAWSEWSPTPVVVSQKQPTITPPIQINGMFSNILPSVDGRTTVPLTVAGNYTNYEWRRVSDNALVSSTANFNAPVGEYRLKVTEQFGCSSEFSTPYKVTAANGANIPDNVSNFSGYALTSNSIRIDWNDNPTPLNNETSFEIYRSRTPGSGYQLIHKTAADVLGFTDVPLVSNTKYYYVIRAVNNNGAAPISSEINVTTKNDVQAPTAPVNLRVVNSTRTSVSLEWDASTDDVGIDKYDVYVNGVKAYVTANTFVTVSNLTPFQTYALYAKAKDLAGNESVKSNQVSATAALRGLNYKYYHGTWSVLPDFNALTPEKVGNSANADLSVRARNDNIGFLWEGSVNIPVSGNYTFETRSDDGSKLYIGSYSHTATALVNNDGAHGMQSRTGTIYLTAGSHPIAVTFFQGGGGFGMELFWQSTEAGITRQRIPNTAFTDGIEVPANQIMTKPSNLRVNTVSYNRLNVLWDDNSNNENGFEVTRSTSATGTYITVGTVGENETSIVDSVGLASNTKYFYNVRAINQFGATSYISTLQSAWGFNSSYADGSGNNRNLTAGSNPNFNTADKKEGTAAISLNGSNQFADMPFSTNRNYPSNEYTDRTVGLWIKPVATTITASNKIIFDFGGSDNGLSLRFRTGFLEAGIANGNVRATAGVGAITTMPYWVVNGWNHVVVSYHINELKLFVNGTEVASTILPFSAVANTTNASRIGATNSSNAFNSSTSGTNFGGLIDDVVIYDEPITLEGIAAMMLQSYASGTTLELPEAPAPPAISSASAASTTSILLEIADNSSNETNFEIHRSVGNNTTYRLLSTLPANEDANFSFTDNDLFANATYFYKVRSVGVGGTSEYSDEVSVITLNNLPVFVNVANSTMRFDGNKTINIVATDADADALTFNLLSPLPSFGTFVGTGTGTANIQFIPTSAGAQGVYPIVVEVVDIYNGKDTLNFVLTVNNNYIPVFTTIANRTVAEGSTTNVAINVSDLDGNAGITIALSNAPTFVTLTDNGNGAGSLTLAPTYANGGVYQVTVSANDMAGATEQATFTLTVTEVEPATERFFMSMKYTGANAPAPWNNISTPNTNNLLNNNGQSTPVGIEFIGTPWNAGDAGAVTGNNSGVYPDAVIRDYFWFGVFGAPNTINTNLKGLDPAGKYNITLFGSSSWTGLGNNGTTIYTINGVPKPLYVDRNSNNTVSFTAIQPNASGIITINMSKGANTPYGLLNAIVVEKPFDDGTAPVLPTSLAATALENGNIRLNWNDVAYNEVSYLMHRAIAEAGPYTVLNPSASNANATSYTDNTVSSSTTYYYKLEAVNQNGTSGFTAVVNATTGNRAPVISSVQDVVVKSGEVALRNFSTTDDAVGPLNITVTGLPSFATYQSTGNGAGSISFAPSTTDIGVYNDILITATDASGASATRTFKVRVIDNALRNVFVNFGVQGGISEPTPWNNFLIFPYANAPLSSLNDDAGVNTGFSVRLQQQWDGNFNFGTITGYNEGIFPDNVLQSSFYTTSSAGRGIQIDGLNPSKRYNVVFLSSHNAGPNAQVTFSAAGQSVTQESRYNSIQSVQLNGLTSTASGQIVVTATKNASAAYLNLNAMVIQEYNVTDPLLKPYYLFAESILENGKVKFTWADRSANETGFELYGSTSPSSGYSLLAATGADVTTFTATGLNPNIRHYFRVRAINATQNSDYSNIASMVLSPNVVFVNFNANAAQNAATPWNNTNGPSVEGATFSNLRNNSSENSGIELAITKEFNGPGFTGSAGAGIFPSVVMQSNYWTDAGQLSQIKISNLDIRRKYKVGLFGSAIFSGYSFANYTCNGKTVQLNSISNNSKVVYLKDLVTENGELIIDVRTTAGSPYSFTGAVTIESYEDVTPYEPVNFNGRPAQDQSEIFVGDVMAARGSSAVSQNVTNTTIPAKVTIEKVDVETVKPVISVHPNPFTNRIDVEINNEKASNVTVMLYDLNSRLIYRSADQKQTAGRNKITVNLPSSASLLPGNYVVSIMIDGKLAKSVKLIKVN